MAIDAHGARSIMVSALEDAYVFGVVATDDHPSKDVDVILDALERAGFVIVYHPSRSRAVRVGESGGRSGEHDNHPKRRARAWLTKPM